MDNVMTIFLIGLLASVSFWFLWRGAPRTCPTCNNALPLFYAPWRKSRRQWVNGGYSCAQCQIEVDLQGNVIASDAPAISNRAFFTALTSVLLVPILAVAAAGFVFFRGKELIEQQASASEVEAGTPVILRRPAPVANTFDAGREEIRARIVLHEHGMVHGGDLYSFGVEFENLSLGSAAWVEFDAQDVKLEVTDDHGRIVPRSSVQRSGPVLPVCRALIPPAGYTVFSTHDQGMGIVGGQKRFNAGYEAWHLTHGGYQISGSVLVRIAFAQKVEQGGNPFARDQPKIELRIPTVRLAPLVKEPDLQISADKSP